MSNKEYGLLSTAYIAGAVTSEDSERRCSPTGREMQPALNPDSQGSDHTKLLSSYQLAAELQQNSFQNLRCLGYRSP